MNLEQLKQELRFNILDPTDEGDFHLLVNAAMEALHLSDTDVAELFTMSRPSVRRWMKGRSAPHPVMRPHVYRKFLQLVIREIVRCDCNCHQKGFPEVGCCHECRKFNPVMLDGTMDDT